MSSRRGLTGAASRLGTGISQEGRGFQEGAGAWAVGLLPPCCLPFASSLCVRSPDPQTGVLGTSRGGDIFGRLAPLKRWRRLLGTRLGLPGSASSWQKRWWRYTTKNARMARQVCISMPTCSLARHIFMSLVPGRATARTGAAQNVTQGLCRWGWRKPSYLKGAEDLAA